MTRVFEVVGTVDPGALGMLDDDALVVKHDDQLLVIQPESGEHRLANAEPAEQPSGESA